MSSYYFNVCDVDRGDTIKYKAMRKYINKSGLLFSWINHFRTAGRVWLATRIFVAFRICFCMCEREEYIYVWEGEIYLYVWEGGMFLCVRGRDVFISVLIILFVAINLMAKKFLLDMSWMVSLWSDFQGFTVSNASDMSKAINIRINPVHWVWRHQLSNR